VTFLEWLGEHLIAALRPEISVDVDDDLYTYVEREQDAIRARLRAARDVITRRDDPAREDRPEDAR
jgi:hypothetical protein